MTNTQLVNEFVSRLIEAPDLMMQAVALRLSATDYELKLLKADPCKAHYDGDKTQRVFSFEIGERRSGQSCEA